MNNNQFIHSHVIPSGASDLAFEVAIVDRSERNPSPNLRSLTSVRDDRGDGVIIPESMSRLLGNLN
jgi:hypothetical protein